MKTKVNAAELPENSLPYLASVSAGFDVDIRTPLFGGKDRDVVADKILDQMLDSGLLYPELEEYELSQREKIGPMSIRLPFKEREAQVEAYYNSGRRVSVEISEDGIKDIVGDDLPYSRLRPISSEESMSLLPLNSNSGTPLFRKRKDVQEESLALAKQEEVFPAMLGWRGQAKGEMTAQRVVWMFPFSVNIREGRFFRPLQDLLMKNLPYFAAWESMDEVDRRITSLLFNQQAFKGSVVLSSDFSSFDQTVVDQQMWFFTLVKLLYQAQYAEEIEELQHILATIEIICTRWIKYTGRHGVPSGSVWTNILDSLVNLLSQNSSPVILMPTHTQVQGDDGAVLITDVSLHLAHLEACGFSVNPDKQYVSEHTAIYLQRMHSMKHQVGGFTRGSYPIMRATNSLLGQERYHQNWNADLEALRTYAILENTKWHPWFVPFVEIVAKEGDKYLMEFTRKMRDPKFQSKVTSAAHSIPGFVPTYNQSDTINNFRSFHSVQVVSEMMRN
jgi:hypothetical protein